MNWPRTISKKELAIILGFFAPNTGRIYYYKLYKLIFNDSLLEKLKISRTKIKNVREFDFDKTETILQHLDISMHELDKIKEYSTIYNLSTI